MKIAIATPEFPPMNAAAASRTGPWVDALEQRGHEVIVLTSRGAKDKKNPRVWTSRHAVPSSQAGLAKRFIQEIRLGRDVARELHRRSSELDFAVITSPPFFMASLCAKTARRNSLPYLFDVRDRYPAALFDLDIVSSSGLIGRMLSRMEKRAYAGARLVSTVTHGLTKAIGGFVGEKKVFRMPNGFDGKFFPENLEHRAKRPEFTVVYHGRLGRFYDLQAMRNLVRETAKLDAGIRFLFIGDIGPAKTDGDWGTAEFRDEMSLDCLGQALSECHLGVCLLKEVAAMRMAFPAKVFEFLGSGLPVLASPSGEFVDFLSKRGVGLPFERADPVVMARAIVDLKQDVPTWKKMSAHAWALRPELDRRLLATFFAERLETCS
ncbi:MAG: glycosyltransferase family 4 protein [Opitutales bacterium]